MSLTSTRQALFSRRRIAEFGRQPVATIMDADLRVGHARSSAVVLASYMIDGFGSVPIVDEGRQVLGVVSEFDLLALLVQGRSWGDVSAREIMTSPVISVQLSTPVQELTRLLQSSHLLRVPVLDETSALVGLVTRRDVIRRFLCFEGPVGEAGSGGEEG